MKQATVYLVDDNDAFRRSTAWLFESAGFQVSEFDRAQLALESLEGYAPYPGTGCVVSDVRMPEMNGLELQDALRRRSIGVPVILVTAHGDVPLAVEAMRRGAVDFVEKPFSDERIISVVKRALASRPTGIGASPEAAEKISGLTPRERQVLDLVVASKPNKLIAYALGISIKTVELHRANMMAKLGVRSVPDLMKLVLGHGC